jgi:hypothetical protein
MFHQQETTVGLNRLHHEVANDLLSRKLVCATSLTINVCSSVDAGLKRNASFLLGVIGE